MIPRIFSVRSKKKHKEIKVQDTNFLSSNKWDVISLNSLLFVIYDERKNSSEKGFWHDNPL